jgi:hypothetical protein
MHTRMAARSTVTLFPGVAFLVAAGVLIAISIATGLPTRRFVRQAATGARVVTMLNAGGAHPDIEFTMAAGGKVR